MTGVRRLKRGDEKVTRETSVFLIQFFLTLSSGFLLWKVCLFWEIPLIISPGVFERLSVSRLHRPVLRLWSPPFPVVLYVRFGFEFPRSLGSCFIQHFLYHTFLLDIHRGTVPLSGSTVLPCVSPRCLPTDLGPGGRLSVSYGTRPLPLSLCKIPK